jgi:GT2 family glycosyltransferase
VRPIDETSNDEPLLTIITPCLNRAEFIADAVESVLEQDYPRIEHLIVDGGSTDGTLRVLENYPHLRVVSEPDRGLYDAINKGLRLSRGSIIGHLNSDDLYEPYTLGNVVEAFRTFPSVESVAGGVDILETDYQGRRRVVSTFDDPALKRLRLSDVTRGVPITNGRCFRRSLYDRIGVYDIRYRIAADRELLLRALIAGMQTAPVEGVIYHYRQHAGSLTFNAGGQDSSIDEYLQIARRYMNDPAVPWEVRRECRLWRSQQYAWAMMSCLRDRDITAFARRGVEAFRDDPAWLVRFIVQGLLRRYRGIGRFKSLPDTRGSTED